MVRGEAQDNAGLPRACTTRHLVSVVRQRRNADQQWGAVVARKRKLAEEWAAAAPARAAQNKRKRERERAERARAPPPTRASHPRPAYVVSPTRTLPRDPMAPLATRGRVHLHGLPWSGAARALLEAASSDSESEVDDFWSDQGSVDELAAFGVVVGTALAPTIPDFDTYIDGRPGCYFIRTLVSNGLLLLLAMFVYNKTTRSKLRAGGWRGAESAEGAAPRSPPASAVHDKGVEFEGIASRGVEGAGKRRRRRPPEPPGERRSLRD